MQEFKIIKQLSLLLLSIGMLTACQVKKKSAGTATSSIYAKNNLVAWCIVPFDSKKRNSLERAQMLTRLGINKLAYDWRPEHVPQFDTEIQTLKQNNITLQSFWLFVGPDPEKEANLKKILEALKRNNTKTEIWLMVGNINMNKMSQQQKVDTISRVVKYVATEASKVGCSVGLYNHGGWYGEPENQLAIISHLKMPTIGMVYNFHHAEEQVERFPAFFPKIIPHLFAVNISGLQKRNPAKVVPVGQGDEEYKMMRIIKESAYKGPIGIINENTSPDAEDGLRINMDGLVKVVKAIGDNEALKTYIAGN